MMNEPLQPVYNIIGKTYDVTRKADPYITQKIIAHLGPEPNKKYLDMGCGSGNYTGALNDLKINIEGVDISFAMLQKARAKYPNITWHEGDARQLPFAASDYDGAICILATHHIKDIEAAFKEAFRVIHRGRLVIFTTTPAQCQQYWLIEYFPKMIAKACQLMIGLTQITRILSDVGFSKVQSELYFVTQELQDLFLHAGKYRPEIYLNPEVRAGMSFFHLLTDTDEIASGVAKLEIDINSGKIHEIINQYENTIGDYLFIVAEK